MFPKPSVFKFSQDAFKFIGVLFGIALIGMIYTYAIMVSTSVLFAARGRRRLTSSTPLMITFSRYYLVRIIVT